MLFRSCVKGTANQVVLNTAPLAADAGIEKTTITLTTGTYAIGSIVAATDSDLNLTVSSGVAPEASFVWSDASASGHSFLTADWTNGYLVKNLPTDTQNLVK